SHSNRRDYARALHYALPIVGHTLLYKQLTGGVHNFRRLLTSEKFGHTLCSVLVQFHDLCIVNTCFALNDLLLLFTSDGFLALARSEEHTTELQSRENIVCRL